MSARHARLALATHDAASARPPAFAPRSFIHIEIREILGVENLDPSPRARRSPPPLPGYRVFDVALLGSASIVLSGSGVEASRTHQRLHQLDRKFAQAHGHGHGHAHSRSEAAPVEKRKGTCSFISDDSNVFAVTPDAKNAGWGMSPDQECTYGSYCPYACKPGMVSTQWKPGSKYAYPESMDGGLFCGKDGKLSKPFPDRPYCVEGVGSVKVVNKCKSQASWCQTMLPGNENMIIPTLVKDEATLAVPDHKYWAGTAAHGIEDCKWGDANKAIGNWAAYVAGANADENGQTFVKLGYNPIWEGSALKSQHPGFGLRVECDDCVGTPCELDPSSGVGKIGSKLASPGAGGSGFCVVTVPAGKTANIVMFDTSGGGGGDDSSKSSSKETPSSTSSPPEEPSTTVAPPTSTSPPPTSPSPPPTTSSSPPELTTSESTPSSSKKERPTLIPGIFHENTTSPTGSDQNLTSTGLGPTPTASGTPPKVSDKKGEAGRQQGSAAVAGLVVAFIAAAVLF
ncbi:SUN family beta-glucosidase-like protein [Purpureocillium lavendulum]|uniref:SUN family beta-glucosidase-like protein n=1 Tax=Purpureocillium lavendulum TaxID=1247861 RepID=A0AB34G1T1_9HYPO|nr:SUN family beta-glucosidase-like protein [Purpureocillium lavendulum]